MAKACEMPAKSEPHPKVRPEMTRANLAEIIHSGQRDQPDPGEIITRAMSLVPTSLRADARTVRAVLTTEDPVPIYDWRSGEIVLEVLQVGGCDFDDQTPLLRDHRQYSVDSILGSIREVASQDDELVGQVEFGRDLDPDAEKIWRRVEQGHLRRLSVGYDYTRQDYVTLRAGEAQTIGGRVYQAPKDRGMRVVTKWRLREVSVVVIPADRRAMMRAGTAGTTEQRGTPLPGSQDLSDRSQVDSSGEINTRQGAPVNPIISFLRGHGLAESVTDVSAALTWARSNLSHEHVARLGELCRAESVEFNAAHYRQAPSNPDSGGNPGGSGSGSGGQRSEAGSQGAGDHSGSLADGVRAERERQSEIRLLASQFPQLPAATVTRCIDEGLSLDQTRAAFLEGLRSSAQDGVDTLRSSGPGIHTRGGDISIRELQAGLMLREGIDPDSACMRSAVSEVVTRRRGMQADWIAGGIREGEGRDVVEQTFENARHRGLHNGSLMRFCEEICRRNGGSDTWSEDEVMERAFSSGDFSAVFGAVIHMSMIAGYVETPATYEEFCRVIDVRDFRPNKEAMVNGVGRLKKQGKPGGEAALLNVDDPTLMEVTAERYAGQLKISDQTIINDTFGITGQMPREVGVSARAVPTDLAWSIMLGNPDLADGNPFFHTGTNRVTADLDEAGLAVGTALLKNKKIGNKRIVISETVLLHGTTLSLKAKKILNATTLPNGADNVSRNSYRRVEDNVIDVGCSNPATDPETPITGLPGSYFLFGEPKRSLTVAFRRGTNRGPVIRQAQLDKGEWGVVWDVYVDTGAAPTSRLGAVRCDIS